MGEVVGSLLLVLARRRGEVRLLEGCDKEDRAKESEGDNETLRFFSMVVVVAVVVVVVLVVVVFWRALDRGVVSLGGGCVANNDEEDACELSSKGVVGTRKLVPWRSSLSSSSLLALLLALLLRCLWSSLLLMLLSSSSSSSKSKSLSFSEEEGGDTKDAADDDDASSSANKSLSYTTAAPSNRRFLAGKGMTMKQVRVYLFSRYAGGGIVRFPKLTHSL